MNRSRDWWVQAEADLRHARHALEEGAFEWACFASHQAAEKAIKAVFEARGQQAWGYTITHLLAMLDDTAAPSDLLDMARVLDKHYIPTRYPNGLAAGAPPSSTPDRRRKMPSAIQKRSYGSVTIYSIDKVQVQQALEAWAEALRQRPEVLGVILFGSMAANQMGVGSDVDLLVILSESDLPFLDRTVVYRPRAFPVDIDIFPYTIAEIAAGQKLAEEALRTGQVLWLRDDSELTKLLKER